jgi:hypothetical protein
MAMILSTVGVEIASFFTMKVRNAREAQLT